MARLGWVFLFAGVLAAAGLGAAPADPFPVRRVRVTESQLPEALKQLDAGPVVKLPRAEFESRVSAAGEAAAAKNVVPRLVRADYAASLTADDDLAGTAGWELLNPAPRAAFPLDSFRLAVKSATWDDGRDAVIGALGAGFPAAPSVWVEGTGRQRLTFAWSLAGSAAPGERRFELRVPPCPSSVLDLTLPANRTPVPPADVLLTGPADVPGQPGQRVWRFRFGDRPKLDFAVRAAGNPVAANFLRASLAAKYELTPGQLACAFEYDLTPTHGAVGEWVFAVDPALRVTDAAVFNRAGWRIDGPPRNRRLHVTLKQPGTGGKVLVTAVAPLAAGPLPMVRPVNAAVGEERIDVRLSPEIKLRGWDAGDYRLTETSGGADQARAMAFTGGLAPESSVATFRRAPAVYTTPGAAEFTTREGVEWRAENGRAVLVARLAVRVRRGPLFGLTVQTPPGYDRVRVTAGSDDLIGHVEDVQAPHGIVIEFVQPLAAGQLADLRIELRGPPLPTPDGKQTRLPLPRILPFGAAERDGWVSMAAVPGWIIAADLTSGPTIAFDTAKADPPLPADAAATFAYRGREPEGGITFSPVRPAYSAERTTRARINGGRVLVATRFDVRVRAGVVASVVVHEDGPPAARSWVVPDGSNTVTATVIDPGPFAGLMAVAAPGGDVRTTLSPLRGTYWLLRFSRPVTTAVSIESSVAVPDFPTDPTAAFEPVSVPLPTLLRAESVVSPVELGPVLVDRVTAELVDGQVVFRPRPAMPSTDTATTSSGLRLTTAVRDDELEVALQGTVNGVAGSTFLVTLPDGAERQSAAVGGHWVGSSAAAGTRVRLPIPAAGTTPFEVRYRLRPERNGWLAQASSPLPELPGERDVVTREWHFASDVLPLWAVGDGDESVAVVPARRASAAGFALAGLFVALGLIGARRFPFATGLASLLSLGAFGVGVVAGSDGWDRVLVPPLAAALAVFSLVAVRRGWLRPSAPVAVVLAAYSFSLFPTHAQQLTPDTVFILPGPADAPEKETVFAPRSLLDKLDAAGRQPEPAFAVTAANYRGRLDDAAARFTATFTVHSFRDGDTAVSLPLSDVQLEGATVDAKPAFPIAVRPDLYSITVTGRGRHEVVLRFAVPVVAAGADRDVRFGGPEVVASKLQFSVPGNPELLQAVGRVGGQAVTSNGEETALNAELGAGRTVGLRWRQPYGGNPVMQYREACIWDVAEGEAELNACYLLRVEKGAAARLRIDLPAELEPSRVTVRSADAPAAAAGLVRDWKLGPEANGFRPLLVELVGPSDGRLVITLECVPRRTPSRRPLLRFPRFNTPGATPLPEGIFYALRPGKVEVDDLARTGVIDLTPDELLFHFGGVADLKLDPTAPGLIAFKPTSTTVAAELRPTLQLALDRALGATETTWRVGPARSDAAGTVRWLGGQPLAAAEFDFPAIGVFGARVPRVVVGEVRGADVAGWGQHGGRVQVWFRKPVKDPLVEWVGRPALAPAGKPDPLPVEAFTPRPINVAKVTHTVRLRSDPDSAVRVQRDKGWKPSPTGAGREWVFTTDQAAAPVVFHMFPPLPASPARGFGMLDVSRNAATYRGTVEVPARPGRPVRLAISVTGLPPQATVELDVPPGVVVGDRKTGAGGQSWALDVPAANGPFRVSAVIRFAATDAPVRLPVVAVGPVEGTTDSDEAIQWVGLTGSRAGLTLRGATPAALADVQGVWPGEAERLRRGAGSLWRVPAGNGAPTLVFPQRRRSPDKGERNPDTAVPSAGETPQVVPSHAPIPWPVVGWGLGVVAVLVLFLFAPRATWPEQVGLAVGLCGVALSVWWLGLAAYSLARVAWAVSKVRGVVRRSVPTA